MKLSTRGRYGLKAVYQLAIDYVGDPIPIKEIADKQNLSESYLEQLFSTLRKDGIINSVRGAQGGYILTREPKDITVGQILRSLEGDMAPSECILEGEMECSLEEQCVTRFVWIKIKESVDSVIDSITLQDMINDRKKQIENQG